MPLLNAFRRTAALTATLGFLAQPSPLRAQAPAAAASGMTTEKLADGIYLIRASSDLDLWTATNSVVVINDKDVTVFDSFTRAGTARMAIAEIKKLTDKPVRWLINSHWHMDHWSGNNEFIKAWPAVQIVATTQTRDFMKGMGPAFFADEIGRQGAAIQARLDTAARTGKYTDGRPYTPELVAEKKKSMANIANYEREVRELPRILPTVAYRDTLVFFSGAREFRLYSATGDATAETVMYLPAEQLLVTGDVLVAQEDGTGPPPWTTNSYSIVPWLASLRSLQTLDLNIIVPGQGKPFHDKRYLDITIDLWAAIIQQVHAAIARGVNGLANVQAAVDVDAIVERYQPGATKTPDYRLWLSFLVKKVYLEARDGTEK